MNKEMFEVIKTRRSTRRFKDRMVEKEKLDMVLEAGRYAPSGGNSQRCHFLAISNSEVLNTLCSLSQEAFAAMEIKEDTYPSLIASIKLSKMGNYRFIFNAPVLIVVANEIGYGNNMADSACATENMLLMANTLDLGACYVNQLNWLGDDPKIRAYLKTLGLKDNERVYTSMVLGYPDSEDGLPLREPRERKGNEVTVIE